MSTDVGPETNLTVTTGTSEVMAPQATDKRRPGRSSNVNQALIPLLRGSFPTATEIAPSISRQTEQASSGPPRVTAKACSACKDASAIFPFTMAFQPIVDLQQNRIDAYEALVRGPAGEGAEYVLNQVTEQNTYTFDQACRVKAIELAACLGMDRQLSINFLPNAVYEPRACIQTTLWAAARTGFPRGRLTFEILESETIANTAHLLSIIKEYRKYGFKIALDDFGTGYSGLSRLAELQPDIVKVDRILVKDCDKDPKKLSILAGIIGIGAAIEVKVVLEGVERAGEVDALRSIGGRFIQGYYFSRPTFEAVARDADIAWNI